VGFIFGKIRVEKAGNKYNVFIIFIVYGHILIEAEYVLICSFLLLIGKDEKSYYQLKKSINVV
jgi:hypothetical protein